MLGVEVLDARRKKVFLQKPPNKKKKSKITTTVDFSVGIRTRSHQEANLKRYSQDLPTLQLSFGLVLYWNLPHCLLLLRHSIIWKLSETRKWNSKQSKDTKVRFFLYQQIYYEKRQRSFGTFFLLSFAFYFISFKSSIINYIFWFAPRGIHYQKIILNLHSNSCSCPIGSDYHRVW